MFKLVLVFVAPGSTSLRAEAVESPEHVKIDVEGEDHVPPSSGGAGQVSVDRLGQSAIHFFDDILAGGP